MTFMWLSEMVAIFSTSSHWGGLQQFTRWCHSHVCWKLLAISSPAFGHVWWCLFFHQLAKLRSQLYLDPSISHLSWESGAPPPPPPTIPSPKPHRPPSAKAQSLPWWCRTGILNPRDTNDLPLDQLTAGVNFAIDVEKPWFYSGTWSLNGGLSKFYVNHCWFTPKVTKPIIIQWLLIIWQCIYI